MGFPKNQEDTLEAVVEAYAEQPDDIYWSRRLLEVCRGEESVSKHRALIAHAFATWASYDPAWFVHALGFSMEMPCFYWPKELLEEIESLLTLENASVRHFVLGRLWWEAKLCRDQDPEFAKRAVEHFLQVEQPYRLGKFHENLAEALAVVHPEQLEALADTVLGSVPSYRLADARHTLLEGAARAKNWEAYEHHRALYRSMQEHGQTSAHADCEVLNLDGLVALARGRGEQIPRIFGDLVERGANVAFLGGRDTMRLISALLERKEHLEACRQYLLMIQKQAPSVGVAKILVDVEAAMAPKRAPKGKAKPPKSASSHVRGRGRHRER